MIAARLFFSTTYLCNRPRRFFLETGLGIFLTSFCLKTCKTSLGTPFESGGVWFGSRDRPQVSGCPAGPSSLGVGYRQPPSREAFPLPGLSDLEGVFCGKDRHPDLGGVFGPKTGVFLLAMSGSNVWRGAGVPARDP